MSFANQKSVLIHDQKGNIYNFYWNEGKIIFNFFNKSKEKYENTTLVEEVALEFDCILDNDSNIYLILQKNNGQLLLMSRKDNRWDTSELSKENQPEVFNLNILYNNHTVHIIYCVSSNENENVLRIYHHFLKGTEWKTLELGEIRKKSVLNPFQITQYNSRIIIGFYNLSDHEEQVFMKEFDTEKKLWKNAIQLTSGHNDKLYLDMILTSSNVLHLAYSEFYEGNLVVKYEKYKITDNRSTKVLEESISNPTNCSYPSLIWMKDMLWVCWTEHDQVASCYSKDEGLTWSNPYLWKDTKSIVFFRHKFQTNDEKIGSYYQFNHAFGKGYSDYSFIGFGDIGVATEVPINKKKDINQEEELILRNHNKAIIKEKKGDEISEVNVRNEIDDISSIKDDLRKLELRIENIEQYLLRKRRGIFPSRN